MDIYIRVSVIRPSLIIDSVYDFLTVRVDLNNNNNNEDLEAQNIMSLATAFGQRGDLSDEKNLQLQESICGYIVETKRFT